MNQNTKNPLPLWVATIIRSTILLMLFVSSAAFASKSEKTTNTENTPDAIIQQITEAMLQVIKKHKATFNKKPAGFYAEVEKVLMPVIAFDQFSRGVMGKYAHRATDKQLSAFSQTFQHSLITFYGKAVMVFDTKDITFEPIKAIPKEKIDRYLQKKSRSVPVEMKLRSDNREYGISYSFVKVNNNWQVRNIVVEGVNIGIQFRNQFSDAIEQYKTIDGVIANWSSIMKTQFHGSSNTNEKS